MRKEYVAALSPFIVGFFGLAIYIFFTASCAATSEQAKADRTSKAEAWAARMEFVRSPYVCDLCFGYADDVRLEEAAAVVVPCEKVESKITQPVSEDCK